MKYLVKQVIGDIAVIARKRRHKVMHRLIGLPLQRQPRHLQTYNPAFGAIIQYNDVLFRQFQAHHSAEELGGLCRGEA